MPHLQVRMGLILTTMVKLHVSLHIYMHSSIGPKTFPGTFHLSEVGTSQTFGFLNVQTFQTSSYLDLNLSLRLLHSSPNSF